jgi:26S proteasome regulatory subunit N2
VKKGDVEMKSKEPPSTMEPSSFVKDGDVLPINSLILYFADDGKPSFKKLPNFSWVVPAQLMHITFPADGRYQHIWAIPTKAPSDLKNEQVCNNSHWFII